MTNMIFEMSKCIVSTEVGMKVANITKDQVIKHAPELTTKAAERTAKVVSFSAGLVTGTIASAATNTAIETGKDIAILITDKVQVKVNEFKAKKEVAE